MGGTLSTLSSPKKSEVPGKQLGEGRTKNQKEIQTPHETRKHLVQPVQFGEACVASAHELVK